MDLDNDFQELLTTVRVFENFQRPWLIAGGWALDLFLQKRTRTHKDIDIGIFRKDQTHLKEYLKTWRLQKVVDGKLEDWSSGESLALPVHEIHGKSNCGTTSLEVLLQESDRERWIFRRETSITRDLDSALSKISGISYLSPEIVLLFKAKNTRPVDEEDFLAALPHLSNNQRAWLQNALEVCHPEHHWLEKIQT